MTDAKQPGPFGRIFPPDEAWLAKGAAEEIIEPELAIVDTHHHFWSGEGLSGHHYLLDDWLADSGSGHNVEASVFIECRSQYRSDGPIELRPVGEVEFVADITAQCQDGNGGRTRTAAGIVGFANLALGKRVEPVLAALDEAGDGRFRGIRHSAGWDKDPVIGSFQADAGPGFYLRDDFREGLGTLTALGMSLDALVYHPQLDDMVALARACPEANIIANHTGMPLGYGPYGGKQDEVFAQWQGSMKELAGCENVTLKLGGMMMRLASFDYLHAPEPLSSQELAEHWRPYIEPCIEWFGAERCMFESNFPVDKLGIGYAPLWNTFKRIAAGASVDEKAALFAGTARRAYRLS